jgi:hypothetical protein
MGRVYLANAFSPSMLPLAEGQAATVCVKRVDPDYAGEYLQAEIDLGNLDCAIGHPSTAKLAEELLVLQGLKCERKMIQLSPGDTLVVLSLTFRPPEGKVYTYTELYELYKQGKIAVWLVHYGPC